MFRARSQIFGMMPALFLWTAFIWDTVVQASDWEKIYEKDELIVYMKEPGKDGTISVRGEGILNFPLAAVYAVLEDNKRASQWMPLVKERRILKQLDPLSRIEMTHIGLPWPIKDRYFIDLSRLEKKPDGTQVISIKSVEKPQKEWLMDDKVLGFLHYSELKLVPIDNAKKTRLTIEVNTDPRGEIPLWLVNLEQRQWPKKFIEGLRMELESDLKAKNIAH